MDLQLEPLETEAPQAASTGPARFSANTRASTARRKEGERRLELRLEEPRRSGTDRRPRRGWDESAR